MENHSTEPVKKPFPDEFEGQDLDNLLSQRGKPFANWKEERLYLREKWGMQGRKVEPGDAAPTSGKGEESKV
jgi:hypothetical protein